MAHPYLRADDGLVYGIMARCIDRGFVWATTPEGPAYWHRVYKQLLDYSELLGYDLSVTEWHYEANGRLEGFDNVQLVKFAYNGIMEHIGWLKCEKDEGFDWSEVYKNLKPILLRLQGSNPAPNPTPKATPKPKRSLSPDTFRSILAKRGYKRLGSGMYSEVWGKPDSTRVIKINNTMDDWPAYIKWATDNGYAGVFAPKVYALKVFNKGTDKIFYVAEMDRYATTVNNSDCRDKRKLMNNLETLMRKIKPDSKPRRDSLEYYEAKALKEWASDHAPGFYEFAEGMREQFSSFDLHGGNWMIDYNGKIILTDPISGHYMKSSSNVRIKKSTKEAIFA